MFIQLFTYYATMIIYTQILKFQFGGRVKELVWAVKKSCRAGHLKFSFNRI